MDDWIELEQVMVERKSMYRFLAGVYHSEIDLEFLDQVTRMDFPTDTGVPDIDHGFQMLTEYLNTKTKSALTDLAVDFVHVFLGTGSDKAGAAFPFESVYTSPRGLLMQDARDQVFEWYRREGIQLTADSNEPEDHLAFELEFLAHLCLKTAHALRLHDNEAAAYYLQAQHVFLQDHILNWLPRFCSDVIRIAKTDFYKGIALITAGYIAVDMNLMAGLTVELSTDGSKQSSTGQH